MTQWIELSLSRHSDSNVALIKAHFPGVGQRALDWPQFLRASAAVAWLEVPTGNLVLVEAEGDPEKGGQVHASLWAAAIDTVIPLNRDDDSVFLSDHEAHMTDQPHRSVKGMVEVVCIQTKVALDPPTPRIIRDAQTDGANEFA